MTTRHLSVRKTQLCVTPKGMQIISFDIDVLKDILVEGHLLCFVAICVVYQCLDGKAVAVESEAAYETYATWADDATTAEFLALIDVADVHFDCGCAHTSQGIEDGDAGVCVGSGIEYDAVTVEANLVDHVDDFAFQVALEVVDAYLGESCTQFLQVVFPSAFAIDFRLANAQKIKIWAVYNLNSHNKVVFL